MGSPLSPLCRHHTALQMTITWVWDIFLWHLSQELYFPSRFCFTPGTCPFMSAFICLSCLSFYLYYPFLFTYAHHWISWWFGNSNLFDLESRNFLIMLLHNFMMRSPLISSICLIIMKEWIANQDIIKISIISIHIPIPMPKSPFIYIVYIDVQALHYIFKVIQQTLLNSPLSL